MFMTKVNNLFRKISALSWKENDLYIAKAVEVEVASQGKTKIDALNNLKEALELYFEDNSTSNYSETYQDVSLEKLDVRYA
jgi:predicted RNase H-like HicB family nuclease